MASLTAQRTICKAQVIRIINWYERNEDLVLDETQILVKLDALNSHFNKYNLVQDQIELTVCDPPDTEDIDVFEENYALIASKLTREL